MSVRLTPERVAHRELERLARRRTKVLDELQALDDERERWVAVLGALNGEPSGDEYQPDDDGVEAE